MSGNGTTTRDRREEATGIHYIHPIARFPSIIVIEGRSIILTTLNSVATSAANTAYELAAGQTFKDTDSTD